MRPLVTLRQCGTANDFIGERHKKISQLNGVEVGQKKAPEKGLLSR